jgi:hypothetical protein
VSAVDHLVQLAGIRVFVPSHMRVTPAGNTVRVSSYTRVINSIQDLSSDELEAAGGKGHVERLLRAQKASTDSGKRVGPGLAVENLKSKRRSRISAEASRAATRQQDLREGRTSTTTNLPNKVQGLKDRLSPEDERGLAKWEADAKAAEAAGNSRLAAEIRRNARRQRQTVSGKAEMRARLDRVEAEASLRPGDQKARVQVREKPGGTGRVRFQVTGKDTHGRRVGPIGVPTREEAERVKERIKAGDSRVLDVEQWDISDLRNIAESRQHRTIAGVLIDMQSANVLTQVFDALSSENKKRLQSKDLHEAISIAWKLAGRKR